jgi:glycosyltransferase involved in cell wall biosynthesis
MTISVIIPVYNEERDIGFCLRSLEKQSYKDFEVIVVDDGSTDSTIKIAQEFSKVKIIKGKHKGPGFSRNLGAKHAKGDVLVFVDADMTFDREYLRNLVTPIIRDKTKKIIGTTHDYEIVDNLKSIWSRCWGRVRVDARSRSYKLPEIGAPFRAIRKDKFLELGGFDPKYGYADDQTFRFKYNLNPIYAPRTTCHHRNPETLKGVYNQSRWIGASMDSIFIKLFLTRYFISPAMIILSPAAIPLLAFKRCIKNRDCGIFIPWMLIFMTARYFGTVSGLFRKIYLNRNVR